MSCAGNSPDCGTQDFPAPLGWDSVTGLGSSNHTAMLSCSGRMKRKVGATIAWMIRSRTLDECFIYSNHGLCQIVDGTLVIRSNP